jgi:hypothetical protein
MKTEKEQRERGERREEKKKKRKIDSTEKGESERKEKKEKEENRREEAAARDEKLKREARVLFFPFYMFMRISAGQGWYPQGKNLYTRIPSSMCWIKFNPNSSKNTLNPGGAGFCPALHPRCEYDCCVYVWRMQNR